MGIGEVITEGIPLNKEALEVLRAQIIPSYLMRLSQSLVTKSVTRKQLKQTKIYSNIILLIYYKPLGDSDS